MAAGRPIGTAFVEIDLDASRYTRSQQQLYKDATSTTLNIEENFRKLGIKSSAEMDLMRAKITNAFDRITHSSQATANDILRAEQAKNAQLAALNEQQFGKQISLVDRLKENWVAASVAIVAAWAAVNKAMAFLDEAGRALQIESSFRIMADAAGVHSARLIESMKAATKETIDDSDLMQKAVKLMTLAYDPAQIERFSRVVITASQIAGTTAAQAYDDLADAIANRAPRALIRMGAATREQMAIVNKAIEAGADSAALFELAMANLEAKQKLLQGTQDAATISLQRFHALTKETTETLGKGLIIVVDAAYRSFEFLAAGVLGLVSAYARYRALVYEAIGAEDKATSNRQLAADAWAARNALIEKAGQAIFLEGEASAKATEQEIAGAKAVVDAQMQKLKAFTETAEAQKKAEREREQLTRQAIEATRQALVGVQGVGQAPGVLDEARLQSTTEKYRQAGVDRVTIEQFVAAETALIRAKAALEGEKAQEEGFKALRDRGQASLQEELEWMRQRAALARLGPAERIRAEGEAFKFAQGMVERLFAHEQALGQKSLQDTIAHEQAKADAAKQGSEARMKSEEAVYQKQEELRNRARSAALGILGEVGERLAEKGVTDVTQTDVARELMEIQRERGKEFRETAGRFRGGGAVDITELIAGIQAGAKIEDLQKQLGQLGGLGGIFGGATEVAPGPLTEHLGLIRPDQIAGAGDWSTVMAEQHKKNFASMISDVKELATVLQTELPAAGSKYIQNVVTVVEQAFIRKIMDESGRG